MVLAVAAFLFLVAVRATPSGFIRGLKRSKECLKPKKRGRSVT